MIVQSYCRVLINRYLCRGHLGVITALTRIYADWGQAVIDNRINLYFQLVKRITEDSV